MVAKLKTSITPHSDRRKDFSTFMRLGKKNINPHPIKAAIIGFATYCGLLALMPLTVVHEIDAIAVTFVALCYVFFFGGASFAARVRIAETRAIFKTKNVSHQRLLLAVAGIASIILTVVDRFIARGVSISSDWMERREALLITSSTPAAVLGALLMPAIFLYLFSVFRDRSRGRSNLRPQLVFAFSLCMAHPIIGLLLGSRSGLLTSLIFLLAIPLYFRERRINWLLILKIGLISFAVMLFFGLVFLSRLDMMNMSISYSAINSTYAFTVRPSDWALEILSNEDRSFLHVAFLSVINLAQYYTHGLLEVMYQVSNEEQITHSGGAFLFFVPYKFLAMIFPMPDVFSIISASKLSVGSYTSFFGPIHSDFGWFSIVFMFFFGMWSTRIFNISKSYSGHVPLSILLNLSIFLFPVVNFLLLGINFYLLIGFMAFAFWERYFYAVK